jgi:hypothetical protein
MGGLCLEREETFLFMQEPRYSSQYGYVGSLLSVKFMLPFDEVPASSGRGMLFHRREK